MPSFNDLTETLKANAEKISIGKRESLDFGRKWKRGKDNWIFNDLVRSKLEGREEIKSNANTQ